MAQCTWKLWCKPRTICNPTLSSITMATRAPWYTSRMLLKETGVLGLQMQPWLWLLSWCSSSVSRNLQWFLLQGLQHSASQHLQSQQDHTANALSPQISLQHMAENAFLPLPWLCYNHGPANLVEKGRRNVPAPTARSPCLWQRSLEDYRESWRRTRG